MKVDLRVAENPPTTQGVVETRADIVRVFARNGLAYDIKLVNDASIEVSSHDGTLEIYPTSPSALEIGIFSEK